jgi:hypothetical protein
MRAVIATYLLFIACHAALSQENRQIRARKITQTNVRTEQIQKGERAISYVATRYDKKGREVEMKEFNSDSICIKVETFDYNRKGREILHTVTDSLSHKHSVIQSFYDKWNRLTEKIISENNQIQERTLFTYNTFDDKTEEKVMDGEGNLKKVTRFDYDSRSMLTRKTTTNSKGEIVYDKIYRYEY